VSSMSSRCPSADTTQPAAALDGPRVVANTETATASLRGSDASVEVRHGGSSGHVH
jgi:hypothetical protein